MRPIYGQSESSNQRYEWGLHALGQVRPNMSTAPNALFWFNSLNHGTYTGMFFSPFKKEKNN